jgi:hypothetical protein
MTHIDMCVRMRRMGSTAMDAVSPLATQLVSILSPFLPKLAAGAAGQLQEHGGELARQLWKHLEPKTKNRPALDEAIKDVASAPKDEDSQAALRVQLRKLLQDDPTLRQELDSALQQAGATTTTTVTASGERSVAIGGNVTGSTLITGDRNRIPDA